MMAILKALACTVLLICLFGGVFSATTAFGYDGQNQARITYDGASQPVSNYDSVAVLVANDKENRTVGASSLFAKFAEFLAADSGAFSSIGSTGKVGEQWLSENLGGESQVYFNTSQGGRYVDQLANGVANESKVGYQSLTPSIQLQISKDAELLNNGAVNDVNWHFFQSPVTGLGRPSQPLLNALQQNGINVIIH